MGRDRPVASWSYTQWSANGQHLPGFESLPQLFGRLWTEQGAGDRCGLPFGWQENVRRCVAAGLKLPHEGEHLSVHLASIRRSLPPMTLSSCEVCNASASVAATKISVSTISPRAQPLATTATIVRMRCRLMHYFIRNER
jgi:hypothetical protein